MNIKVKQTETYLDSGKTVCKGKLVLVNTENSNLCRITHSDGEVKYYGAPNDDAYIYEKDDKVTIQPLKPIIVSDTEEIEIKSFEKGDEYFLNGEIKTKMAGDGANYMGGKKILAMPEHFSLKHIKAIAEGRLKELDEVFIECETTDLNYPDLPIKLERQIKLTDNHIKLFPVKDELKESIKALNKTLEGKPKNIIEKAIEVVFGKKTYTEEQVIDLMHRYDNRITARHNAERWQTEKWFNENSNKIIKE